MVLLLIHMLVMLEDLVEVVEVTHQLVLVVVEQPIKDLQADQVYLAQQDLEVEVVPEKLEILTVLVTAEMV